MLDIDSSDIDVDDEVSSGMLSFMSPTKRDSLDEGYDPNETLKVIVYEGDEGNKIEIRPSTFGNDDDDDDDDDDVVSRNVDEGATDDDDVHVEQVSMSLTLLFRHWCFSYIS